MSVTAQYAARAWTGEKIVHDFAIRSDGTPLELIGFDSDGYARYRTALRWNWMHWTGFRDRNDAQIFVNDVVEIESPSATPVRAVALFEEGRFVIHVPWFPEEDNTVPIARYCNPVYVHMIQVVGNVFEQRWKSAFPAPT